MVASSGTFLNAPLELQTQHLVPYEETWTSYSNKSIPNLAIGKRIKQ